MKVTRYTGADAASAPASSSPGGPAGGDLGGGYPGPQVTGLDGSPITGTKTDGYVLVYDVATDSWKIEAPPSTAPSGPAGGDLGGTYPNPDVEAIDGVVLSGVPSVGDILTATGSAAASWQAPAPDVDLRSEVLMADGVTAPPEPLEDEARDDWLYGQVA